MKRVIFRGDDAGGSHTANRAIMQALEAGVLRNVSVMVPGPAFTGAISPLKRSSACIGLHVTLNAEWDMVKWGPCLPRAKVPSLVDDRGYFLPTPNHFFERGFSVDEAVAEIEAQYEDARSQGLRFHYIDQHMGVGWLPGLGDRISEFARREGLLDAAEIAYLPGAGAFEERLTAAEKGAYAYVLHPGGDTAEMRMFCHKGLEPGVVARERELDRRFLCDPSLPKTLERAGATSVRYDEVLTPSRTSLA